MQRTYLYILLLLVSLFACGEGLAQRTMQYSINTYNGLPSDNAYCLYRDQYGYLWIGTERGVVKYNGYTMKLFDARNGISHPDVWDFFEDSRGRIWLSRIENELGYIRNDKYHKVHVQPGSPGFIYPKYITEYDGGVRFLSEFRYLSYLYTELNDTISGKKLQRLTKTSIDFLTPPGDVYHYDSGKLFKTDVGGDSVHLSFQCAVATSKRSYALGNFLISGMNIPGADSILIIDMKSCKRKKILLERGDVLYNQYQNRGKYYLVTQNKLLMFEDLADTPRTVPLLSYLHHRQLNNNQVSYVIADSLWGNCIATTKGGVFLSRELRHYHKIAHVNLAKYRHVGSTDGNVHYWWNKEQKILAVMNRQYLMRHIKLDSVKQIESLVKYNENQLLMMGNEYLTLYNNKQHTVSYLSDNYRYYIHNSVADTHYSFNVDAGKDNFYRLPGIYSGIIDKNGTIHSITKGGGYQSYRFSNDTAIHHTYTIERQKGIVHIPLIDRYLVYSNTSAMLGEETKLSHIDERMLQAAGITGIEQIVVDTVMGNIFIKDLKKVLVFHPFTCRLKVVFSRHNSEQAKILVHDGMLIMCGKGGIVFAQINGSAAISAPVYYPNTKALAYRNFYDAVPSDGQLLLNTDSGLLTVAVPTPEMFKNARVGTIEKYKFVLRQRGVFQRISHGDTIILEPRENSIEFDLVNPDGVGALKFWSKIGGIDSGSNELKAGEQELATIAPGEYYSMQLRAGDDVWISPDIDIVLYRTPTFWQTTMGKAVLFSCIATCLVVILLVTIYYTRKIVSAGHLKKNYLLSLELKAIHAQINPHFIFNTLNTGLYFISENRNREAYQHISSFSELLRSYIKSARNKYIPLSEEIENLENYIQLQSHRFEDKFTYEISAADNIHTETTLIPSLLIQPFVENAIQHGFLNSNNKGHLVVRFISDNPENEIICIVDDNGVGRKRSAQINRLNPNKPNSYGNTLIADLVKLINTDGRLKVQIDYKDKSGSETGTTVIITIKKNTS